jgi:TPP-dependent trihydroxycyclohexane-1,2-dione (THcHDO) dehydratase
MSKLKSVTSGLTAVALVAGIGLAYAQATNDSTTMPSTTTTAPTNNAAGTTAMPADSSGNAGTSAGSTGSAMASDAAPKADRN